MRYHPERPYRPWPLIERLWEAKGGIWIGLLMAVFWLVVVFVLGEIACIGYLLISRPNGPPDLSPGAMIPVALALNQWHLLLIWCFIGAFSQWMRSLDLVNDEAWTFEQLVLSRFDEIDHQFGELTGKPLPGYLRTDEETEVAIKDPE